MDKVESALTNFAHAEADFLNTYVQKIDALIPFSGVSDPQTNNGVEKAAAVAGTVASFAVPEGEGGKLVSTGLQVSEHAAMPITFVRLLYSCSSYHPSSPLCGAGENPPGAQTVTANDKVDPNAQGAKADSVRVYYADGTNVMCVRAASGR